MAYLKDILIYSNTFEEHQHHVTLVLQAFEKAGPHLKPVKCEFQHQEVEYLGLIISTQDIKIDPEKICPVQDWEPPCKLNDFHAFLGFANLYCCFVWNSTKIVQLLTFLTCQGVAFTWNEEQQSTFVTMKETFSSVPIHAPFDQDWDVTVGTNPPDYVYGRVLSQYNDAGLLHPAAYFSTNDWPAECVMA
jgi:hypothetical protein